MRGWGRDPWGNFAWGDYIDIETGGLVDNVDFREMLKKIDDSIENQLNTQKPTAEVEVIVRYTARTQTQVK